MKKHKRVLVLGACCFLSLCGAAVAQDAPVTPAAEKKQDAGEDSAALAQTIQNPIANMITLPLQANFNNGVGPDDRLLFNLNVQPVIPFSAGEDWNVISRTIIPVSSVPQGETESTFGIGDTTMAFYLSPAKSGEFIWAVGPILGLPTASNPEVLGSDKWGAGPSAIALVQPGNWTIGGVASNLWSVAGDDDRDDYNMLTLQYFINYNLGDGWALGTAPIITADWKADSDDRWTIPWGLQVSKIVHFGSRPVNLLLGYYDNSEHPDGGAESQVRFQINFLFPTAKR